MATSRLRHMIWVSTLVLSPCSAVLAQSGTDPGAAAKSKTAAAPSTAKPAAAADAAKPASAAAEAKPEATTLSDAIKKTMRDATNPVVVMSTSKGDITIELYKKEAPKTVANFLSYVKKGQYTSTIFHRVMPNFMIQGGGYTKDLSEKPTDPPSVNESTNGLSNELGTIAMARTNAPNSATAQFYINTSSRNQFLDKAKAQDGVGYCVFGKVLDGMNAVKAIEASPTVEKPPAFEALPQIAVEIRGVKQVQ